MLINASIDAALLLQRTTPLGPQLPSPAELLFQRRIRSNLPVHVRNETSDDVSSQRQAMEAKTSARFNSSARDLPDLNLNQAVFYQDAAKRTWSPGTIIGIGPEPRSYTVQCSSSGRNLRRNRVLIRPRRVTFQNEPEAECSPDVEYRSDEATHDATQPMDTGAASEGTSNTTQPSTPDQRQRAPERVANERTMSIRRHSTRERRPPAWTKDYITP